MSRFDDAGAWAVGSHPTRDYSALVVRCGYPRAGALLLRGVISARGCVFFFLLFGRYFSIVR